MGLANLALFSLRRTARLRLTTGKHNAQNRSVTPALFSTDCALPTYAVVSVSE
jgi:hypothetical protein